MVEERLWKDLKNRLKRSDSLVRNTWVSRDQAEFPISQTPTLIINGEIVVGAVEYGELRRIVEEKLASKGDSGSQ